MHSLNPSLFQRSLDNPELFIRDSAQFPSSTSIPFAFYRAIYSDSTIAFLIVGLQFKSISRALRHCLIRSSTHCKKLHISHDVQCESNGYVNSVQY